MASGAKDRMRDELGPDFDDMDWKKLDPRQYDPRRIIREALREDASAKSEAEPEPVVIESAYQRRKRLSGAGKPAPFDPDLT
jgi:sec-independent protein translocase protein TatB